MDAKGTIELVKQNEGKYGIKIGDIWYNGFGDAPAKEGDEVSVNYTKNNQWNNISSVEVTKEAPASAPSNAQTRSDAIGETARRRHKLDCLLKSVEAWIAGKLEKDEVFTFGKSLFDALDEPEVNDKAETQQE